MYVCNSVGNIPALDVADEFLTANGGACDDTTATLLVNYLVALTAVACVARPAAAMAPTRKRLCGKADA